MFSGYLMRAVPQVLALQDQRKIYFVYSLEYLISDKFWTISSKTMLGCFYGEAINNTLHNKPAFSLNH